MDLQEMPLGKLSFLHMLFVENEEQPRAKKIQSNIQLFLSTHKLAEKSSVRSCPQPFNYCKKIADEYCD